MPLDFAILLSLSDILLPLLSSLTMLDRLFESVVLLFMGMFLIAVVLGLMGMFFTAVPKGENERKIKMKQK